MPLGVKWTPWAKGASGAERSTRTIWSRRAKWAARSKGAGGTKRTIRPHWTAWSARSSGVTGWLLPGLPPLPPAGRTVDRLTFFALNFLFPLNLLFALGLILAGGGGDRLQQLHRLVYRDLPFGNHVRARRHLPHSCSSGWCSPRSHLFETLRLVRLVYLARLGRHPAPRQAAYLQPLVVFLVNCWRFRLAYR
jgi:hypothetical protein